MNRMKFLGLNYIFHIYEMLAWTIQNRWSFLETSINSFKEIDLLAKRIFFSVSTYNHVEYYFFVHLDIFHKFTIENYGTNRLKNSKTCEDDWLIFNKNWEVSIAIFFCTQDSRIDMNFILNSNFELIRVFWNSDTNHRIKVSRKKETEY